MQGESWSARSVLNPELCRCRVLHCSSYNIKIPLNLGNINRTFLTPYAAYHVVEENLTPYAACHCVISYSISLCQQLQHITLSTATARHSVISYSISLCHQLQHITVSSATAYHSVISYSISLCHQLQHITVSSATAYHCVISYSISLCHQLSAGSAQTCAISCPQTVHLTADALHLITQ
jgi:hypothetical protein